MLAQYWVGVLSTALNSLVACLTSLKIWLTKSAKKHHLCASISAHGLQYSIFTKWFYHCDPKIMDPRFCLILSKENIVVSKVTIFIVDCCSFWHPILYLGWIFARTWAQISSSQRLECYIPLPHIPWIVFVLFHAV